MKLSTKGLHVPTKEVKITGFEDTITIYPIGGFALMKLQEISKKSAENENDPELQEQSVKFALKWGCKCADEDIDYLVQNDLVACMELTKEILEFSSEYNENKFKESELAKKKLKK